MIIFHWTGQSIRHMLQYCRKTQEQLAVEIGSSQPVIARWAAGNTVGATHRKNLTKIAALWNYPFENYFNRITGAKLDGDD